MFDACERAVDGVWRVGMSCFSFCFAFDDAFSRAPTDWSIIIIIHSAAHNKIESKRTSVRSEQREVGEMSSKGLIDLIRIRRTECRYRRIGISGRKFST